MDYGKVSNLTLEEGKLPTYAWPGGYQILYLDEHDEVLCPDCAQRELEAVPMATRGLSRLPDGEIIIASLPVTWFIYYEGPTMNCEGCNKELESEYGDPDEEEEEVSEDDE